jgi:hypothetical protein
MGKIFRANWFKSGSDWTASVDDADPVDGAESMVVCSSRLMLKAR